MIIRDAVEADLPAITEICNTAIATRVTNAQANCLSFSSSSSSKGAGNIVVTTSRR
jgi:L-amino acid N-acyltransferase YncA